MEEVRMSKKERHHLMVKALLMCGEYFEKGKITNVEASAIATAVAKLLRLDEMEMRGLDAMASIAAMNGVESTIFSSSFDNSLMVIAELVGLNEELRKERKNE